MEEETARLQAQDVSAKQNLRIPMNIQFFADGDGGGTGGNAGNGGGTGRGSGGSDNSGAGSAGQKPSFDDFLKGEGNQAEFDRRVNKAIETAVKNAQEKWRIMTDDRVSEAEKLAKMTASEKAEYLQGKKEKELEAREAEITRRELMAEAKNTLAEKKLPAALAEILSYADADSCKKSIETVEKAFQAAVQDAINEKLKGTKPPRMASGSQQDDGSAVSFLEVIRENQSKR